MKLTDAILVNMKSFLLLAKEVFSLLYKYWMFIGKDYSWITLE